MRTRCARVGTRRKRSAHELASPWIVRRTQGRKIARAESATRLGNQQSVAQFSSGSREAARWSVDRMRGLECPKGQERSSKASRLKSQASCLQDARPRPRMISQEVHATPSKDDLGNLGDEVLRKGTARGTPLCFARADVEHRYLAGEARRRHRKMATPSRHRTRNIKSGRQP